MLGYLNIDSVNLNSCDGCFKCIPSTRIVMVLMAILKNGTIKASIFAGDFLKICGGIAAVDCAARLTAN